MPRPLFLILTSLFLLFLLGAACQRTPKGGGIGGPGDVFPQPKVGSVAEFQYYPRWNVKGKVRVINERTLRFEEFTFNGGELRTEIRLQKDRNRVAVLQDITKQVFDKVTFEVTLPPGVNLEDFNLVTVYSPDLGTPVSGARFTT